MLAFLFGGAFAIGRLRVFVKMLRSYILVNVFRKPRIQYVEIMTSYKCNARCDVCSNAKYTAKADSSLLTPGKIKSLIREISDMGVPIITWLGGEPLLDENIYEYVHWTSEAGMFPIVTSNGQLLDERRLLRLRENGVHSIFVTIYSTDPLENQETTNISGYLEKALESIRLGRRLGLKMCLKAVVSKRHFASGEIHRIIDLARDLGVSLSFNPIVPTGAAYDNYRDQVLTRDMQEELDEICVRNPFVTTHFSSNFFGYGCPAGKAYLGITPYGDVIPCYFCPISYGSVWDDSLSSIHQRVLKTPLFKDAYQGCFVAYEDVIIEEVLGPCYHQPSGKDVLPVDVEDHPRYRRATDSLDIADLPLRRPCGRRSGFRAPGFPAPGAQNPSPAPTTSGRRR